MSNLKRKGKYFLVSSSDIEIILEEVCSIAGNLKDVIDESNHLLMIIKNCHLNRDSEDEMPY